MASATYSISTPGPLVSLILPSSKTIGADTARRSVFSVEGAGFIISGLRCMAQRVGMVCVLYEGVDVTCGCGRCRGYQTQSEPLGGDHSSRVPPHHPSPNRGSDDQRDARTCTNALDPTMRETRSRMPQPGSSPIFLRKNSPSCPCGFTSPTVHSAR